MSVTTLTEKDKVFIKTHSLKGESARDISKQLDCSYNSVARYIRKLGTSHVHVYTPQEDALIRSMYNHRSTKYIADLLKVSVQSLYYRAKVLGITRPYNK